MGTLDDVLGSAVPQGSVAKPLIIALGALLASGFKNANSGAASPSSPAPSPPSPDLQAGLGGLLNQFQQNGLGDVMKSWIGPGQNQPVSPNQLSSALGPQIIQILAQKTGLSEQEITSHLSQILPNVVDKLTPNGRLPAQ
ncbi:MAG: YidB family protein [Pseudolabrys sp.]|jgi:uncharacterized protein YidB (DUF937 family)